MKAHEKFEAWFSGEFVLGRAFLHLSQAFRADAHTAEVKGNIEARELMALNCAKICAERQKEIEAGR